MAHGHCGAQTPAVARQAGRDELVSPPSARERWVALPAGRRRDLQAAAIGVAAVSLLVAGVRATEDLAVRDEVRLAASLEVTASSSTADGGRVEHAVHLRNTGRHPLSLERAGLALPGLRGGPREGLPAAVPAGEELLLGLSLRIDCTRSGSAASGLRAEVLAVPASGRRQQVSVPVRAAEALLAQIETLCRARPDLTDVALSGPGARLG